jgi:hypothetical protein
MIKNNVLTGDSKLCPTCQQILPLAQFCSNKQRWDGLSYDCRKCTSHRCRENHQRLKQDPIKYKEYLAKERNRHLKRNFGITAEDYDQMLSSQNGGCAICGATECSSGVALAVDHCHRTGTVRGILCRDCNTTLGKFNDDRNRLRKAIEYLDRAETEGRL